jgi:hypothetical protein
MLKILKPEERKQPNVDKDVRIKDLFMHFWWWCKLIQSLQKPV